MSGLRERSLKAKAAGPKPAQKVARQQPDKAEAAAAEVAATVLGSELNSRRAEAETVAEPTVAEQEEMGLMEQEEAEQSLAEDEEEGLSDDDEGDDELVHDDVRLTELEAKDPMVLDRKSALWMSVDEMKQERRIRGDKSKSASAEGHSNRKTHINGLQKLRLKDQVRRDEQHLGHAIDPGIWDEEEEDVILKDAGLVDEKGKARR